ncbi:MAG TPA: ABC transporter permease [Thermoplasmata archaeon]|nr:ABC transporter permease [Thermoplasmata archaeon]
MTGAAVPGHRRSTRLGGWLILQAVLGGSLLALFVLPIAALFAEAPGRLGVAFRDPTVWASISVTFYASAVCVLVAAALGIPLGYLLARRAFRGRAIVESLVAIPVVVPHLLVGFGLFLLFVPGTPLYRFSTAIGLPVYYSIAGVVLVMVFVSAPYTVLASDLAFRAVDVRTIEAARSLGADAPDAFVTVTLPTALRGIVAGLLLTWARAVSEIGGILILAAWVDPGGFYAGPVTTTVSVFVYNLFQIGDLADAAAVSSLFLLIAFALFVAVRLGERYGRLPWGRGELAP